MNIEQVKQGMQLIKKRKMHDLAKHRVSDRKTLIAAINKQDTKRRQTKLELLKQRLPERVILGIVQHLDQVETLRFAALSKYVRHTVIFSAAFDGQWVIKSFNSLLSKSGFSGIRNDNLRLVDIQLRNMHFQAKSIMQDSKEEQWHIFGVWWNFAFVLYFIVTPVLLMVNERQQQAWPLYILLIPCLLAWVLLICTYFLIQRKINHSLATVLALTQVKTYKAGTPRGRNTQHCGLYTAHDFTVRFLKFLIWSLIYFQFAVYLKVYLLDLLTAAEAMRAEFKWVHVVILGYVPVCILYGQEILKESFKSIGNLVARRGMVEQLMLMAANKSLSDIKIMQAIKHKLPSAKEVKRREAE